MINQSEINDSLALKKRYSLPGNLKIPIEELQRLPDRSRLLIDEKLEKIKGFLIDTIKQDKDECCKYRIDNKTTLFIDYKNGKLNLYLEDEKNNVYTQLLSAELCVKISTQQQKIIKRFKDYLKEDVSQKQENNLTSTLVHSAYNERINNRGSPTIMGKKLDDDFDLDL